MKRIIELIVLSFLSFIIVSCGKPNNETEASADNNFDVPTLSNVTITNLNSYSAVISGTVISSGSTPVTVRGVCYRQRLSPIAYDTNGNAGTVQVGSGLGSFTATITGLTLGVPYFVRTFAENQSGVGYSGNAPTFMPAYAVGEVYEGGVIFYIDNLRLHGFIAAPQDEGLASWGCTGTSITEAYGQAIGSGPQNTLDIINGCATTGIAAALCNNLILSGNTSWFLPSSGELNLLYDQKDTVGGFTQGYYWTSSQYNADSAYYRNFSTDSLSYSSKNTQANVRAIKLF